jgi:1-deoxy-D-xylulose-5-phosphate reductoisomerase
MKKISILGSTGSIGQNTLNIVEKFPDRFNVLALTAKNNVDLLAAQIKRFQPEIAVVFDKEKEEALKRLIPAGTKIDILHGEEGYRAAATHSSVEMVVTAMVGAAGLMPTLDAIEAGKNIALANKETLVMAGSLVMKAAEEKGIDIIPVDSEHSAVFQCLAGNQKDDLDKILLTGSGGPFRTRPTAEFASVSIEDALKHPNWQMGRKITIDSATLMNKGLEVIEAKYLFNVPLDMIEVVIHPQSVIHSMVSYKDGTVMAQLGIPDMKGAIAYALSWPERLELNQPIPDFTGSVALTFEKPDMEKFSCLGLAFIACEAGATLPAVLNAANEIAVHAFLDRNLAFDKIPEVVRQTMDAHAIVPDPALPDIIKADRWARKEARKAVERYKTAKV